MTKINLLPWREEARELERKAFLGKLVASALSGFALVFLWVLFAQNQLDNQNSRNSYLQSNIAEMNKKVSEISQLKGKKQEMLSRMKVIQDLQDFTAMLNQIIVLLKMQISIINAKMFKENIHQMVET